MSSYFFWSLRRPNNEFNLDRLPDDILTEILLYLPFNQRVRIARVNRRLQVVSEITISQTKTLHLTAPCFRRTRIESMAKVIELCAANMEKAIFVAHDTYELAILRERLLLLLGFSFPRLSTIVFVTVHGTSSLFGLIQAILVNIPSLRSLKWEDTSRDIDDTQQMVACESLERVDLKFWGLRTTIRYYTSFLNNCSKLKHLTLRRSAVECIAIMNRMDSLESLILDNTIYCVSEKLLEKIPVSFPQLVNLEMRLTYRFRVSNEAVGWLAKLANLRAIKIEYHHWVDGDHDVNKDALQLIQCESLQMVDFHRHGLNPTAVLDFTRHCSQLQKLTVQNIRGIDSAAAASDFILSMAGFVKQNLTIVLKGGDSNVWQCPEVESALEEINQRLWRRLSIEVANVDSNRVSEAVDPWELDECWEMFPESKDRESWGQTIGRILGGFH